MAMLIMSASYVDKNKNPITMENALKKLVKLIKIL